MLAEGFLGTGSSAPLIYLCSFADAPRVAVDIVVFAKPKYESGEFHGVLPGPSKLCFQERLVSSRWRDETRVALGTLCQ